MDWRRVLVGGALLGGVTAVGLFAWGRRSPAHSKSDPMQTPQRLELHVPHAAGTILLDGDMDDPGWLKGTARTEGFVDGDGLPARPYSDARMAWADGHLYLALYAADEDIRPATDSFHVQFAGKSSSRTIDVNPLGVVAEGPWKSGLHVSHELDGTPDDPHDDDEEWVLEMAIPFESLGLEGKRGEEIAFSVHRCDKPKLSAATCASWGEGALQGVLILD